MITRREALVVAAGSLIATAAAIVDAGQQRSPQQQQRTPREYADLLEEPERVARLQVPRVVGALALKPGMRVADVGAGSGLFTRPIARAIAPGVVYAVDVDKALLDILAARAKDEGLSNVRTVLGAGDDPRLPSPVDLIFICDALHHIANQAAYLEKLRPYLAEGGRIAVIDYRRNWPEGHETLQFSPAQFEGWMKAAGFTRVASHEWIEDAFFDVYR